MQPLRTVSDLLTGERLKTAEIESEMKDHRFDDPDHGTIPSINPLRCLRRHTVRGCRWVSVVSG